MEQTPQLSGTKPANQARPSSPAGDSGTFGGPAKLRRFAVAVVLLSVCFAAPLWSLVRLAATSELYSYILLIPFISLYLVWVKRRSLPPPTPPARWLSVVCFLSGLAVLTVYWCVRPRAGLVRVDYLAVMMTAFLLFFYGVACGFWGWKTLRALAFPLGFLIFMVPIPAECLRMIDAFLQAGSAQAAAGFFWLTGTPFFQDGLAFQLSDISIKIAPECSGIHSSMVLLITSLLASYMFLQTPWKRALLTLFVIPLGSGAQRVSRLHHRRTLHPCRAADD